MSLVVTSLVVTSLVVTLKLDNIGLRDYGPGKQHGAKLNKCS